MANDLVMYERALEPLLPTYGELLAPSGIKPERLIRTVLVSIERMPVLRECTMPSIVQSATTAAVLGLEVDGVTGQGFLIPYTVRGVKTCTFQIGYKGYNTLAARSGYTINAGIVREGDDFEFVEGTGGYVRNKRKLGDEARRAIIGAWATAEASGRPPIICVRSIDQLLATKAKSAGARKPDSPWNDDAIGFPAMCEKTARRGLARSMPLNIMQLAASLDERHEEMGRPAWLEPGGKLVEASATVVEPESAGALAPPRFVVVLTDNSERVFKTPTDWMAFWLETVVDKLRSKPDQLRRYREANGGAMAELNRIIPDQVMHVQSAISEALGETHVNDQ